MMPWSLVSLRSRHVLAEVFGLVGDLLGRSKERGDSGCMHKTSARRINTTSSDCIPHGDPEANLLPLTFFGVRHAGRSNNGFS